MHFGLLTVVLVVLVPLTVMLHHYICTGDLLCGDGIPVISHPADSNSWIKQASYGMPMKIR